MCIPFILILKFTTCLLVFQEGLQDYILSNRLNILCLLETFFNSDIFFLITESCNC